MGCVCLCIPTYLVILLFFSVFPRIALGQLPKMCLLMFPGKSIKNVISVLKFWTLCGDVSMMLPILESIWNDKFTINRHGRSSSHSHFGIWQSWHGMAWQLHLCCGIRLCGHFSSTVAILTHRMLPRTLIFYTTLHACMHRVKQKCVHKQCMLLDGQRSGRAMGYSYWVAKMLSSMFINCKIIYTGNLGEYRLVTFGTWS